MLGFEYIFRFDLVLKLVGLCEELTLLHLRNLIDLLLRLPAVEFVQLVQVGNVHSKI